MTISNITNSQPHKLTYIHNSINNDVLGYTWHGEFDPLTGILNIPINFKCIVIQPDGKTQFRAFAYFDRSNNLLFIYTTEGLSIYDYPKGINIHYFNYVMYRIDGFGNVKVKPHITSTFNILQLGVALDLESIEQFVLLKFNIIVNKNIGILEEPYSYKKNIRVRNPNFIERDGKQYTIDGNEVIRFHKYAFTDLTKESMTIYSDEYCGVSIQSGMEYIVSFIAAIDVYNLPIHIVNLDEEIFDR